MQGKADSTRVPQPIRLQQLHYYGSRIHLFECYNKHTICFGPSSVRNVIIKFNLISVWN